MTVPPTVRRRGPEHTSAVRRLAAARDEQHRLDTSVSRAEVAAREQWLHWIDEGESLEPWADGEWAPDGGYADLPAIRERIRKGENDLRRAVANTAGRTKGHRST